MRTTTLALILLVVSAVVQAQYYDDDPYRGGVDAGLYDSLQRQQREDEEEMYRNRGGGYEGWQNDYNRLHDCAPYNNGCAREFYGRDWP